MRLKSFITVSLLVFFLWDISSCIPKQNFDTQLKPTYQEYRFSITHWEFVKIPQELNQWIFNEREKSEDDSEIVIRYFSLSQEIRTLDQELENINTGIITGDTEELEVKAALLAEEKTVLEIAVVQILEQQIRETLNEQGIFHPLDSYLKFHFTFPAVNFTLGTPPQLLVISPRDRIESIREILLQPQLSTTVVETIESEADDLDVSSLVLGIGGLGATYPSFVNNKNSMRFTINTAVEEWLHQYLTFRPLGFKYLLDLTGISRNYEIATMNETVASMLSKEIGSMIYKKYYSGYIKSNNTSNATQEFNFNGEMREIRKTVDSYLEEGKVEEAEEYMEQKRQYLTINGHYIRKLNQAYFAFHGTYADKPSSISPVGADLRTLRNQSDSLSDFFNTVAVLTSHKDLQDSIK
ncbi:hypothetical protein ACFLXP_05770 [Chloroflexota bacterium]